jgi:hypothetical protein
MQAGARRLLFSSGLSEILWVRRWCEAEARRCSCSLLTGECSALGKMGLRFLHLEESERKELSSMFYRISDYIIVEAD